MNIVIPMAGKSERFLNAGYKFPKALLPLGNKTVIEKIVELFNPQMDNYFFIINERDEKKYKLAKFLNNISVKKTVIAIPTHNKGPVHTLLRVGNKISPQEEVTINYCDFLLDWNYPGFLKGLRTKSYDGGIVSFRGFHPASLGDTHYAYMRVNSKKELLELREKRPFTNNRLLEHASTGTYYFKKWQHVLNFGGELTQSPELAAINGEYYPSQIYNLMNNAGLRSLVFEASKFICLGTPSDYRQYLFWRKTFSNQT